MPTPEPNLPFAAAWLRDGSVTWNELAAVHHAQSIELLRVRQQRALAAFHLERALHDLNNHFHAIELRASFLLHSATRQGDEGKLLHEIEQSVLHARQRIDGFRAQAATPAAAPATARATARSANVSDAVTLAAAAMHRDGGRALVADLTALPPVAGGEDDLGVVLALVFDNAREAGGSVAVDGEAHDGEIVVTVRDDGHGIDAEHVPKLCKPFFTTREGHHGHGLALAVKLLGGSGARLQIANRQDGRGACVTLRLKPATP